MASNYPLTINGGAQIPGETLTATEEANFKQAFEAIAALYDEYGAEPLSGILGKEVMSYKQGAEMAKVDLQGEFGGSLGTNGINMQLIRSATLLTQGASSPVYTWAKNFTSIGWQALFGDSSTPLVLTSSAGGSTVSSTYQNVDLVATHIIDTVRPLYDEIQIFYNRKPYPVFPVTTQKIAGLYVTKLPAPIQVPNKANFAIMANVQRTGSASPQLLGLQYAKYAYAITQ
ncbi:MAG: hypothetical protein ACYDAO_04475 [Thermoplasmataceae archaeon]